MGKLVLLAVGALSLLAVAAALWMQAGREAEPEAPRPALRYTTEYPGIDYVGGVPAGRAGTVAAGVAAGRIPLRFNPERGYLTAVLAALDIEVSSQVLVFSRTSLQVQSIHSTTPRAIYFNDDSFVAWIPGASTLEIASYDPELGPVFYTVSQQADAPPELERELHACLRCHDTYSLTGGGVPRFLMGSGYTGTEGELVSHEAWILTSQATPLRSRWGGWYVTGRHGDQVHLGNIVVERIEDLQDLDALRVGNLDRLDQLIDTSIYLTPYSDIVALLILEHQVEIYNLISRLRYEALGVPDSDQERLLGLVEELLNAMLMLDAVEFSAPISGSSGFAGHFETLGPFDSSGRSLREFDLETRLFRFPLSFLVYSDAFMALPEYLRDEFFSRLDAILSATPDQDGLSRLTAADRAAIAEILAETLP